MKKLGIIGGAGGLGATMGFYIGTLDIFETIVLIDIKENVVKSHEMDMDQALCELGGTKVAAGSWSDLAGCDVVLMTAAVPAAKVKSRNEFLQVNLGIVKSAAEEIKKYCPNAIIITGTNPVDVYNSVFYKILGGDRRRFIGFCRNDSLRMRWAAAKVLGADMRDVQGMVIGEHGETQVPIYSSIKVKGQPVKLDKAQTAKIDEVVKNWFVEFQALDSGRTSTWTSAVSVGFIMKNIAEGGRLGPMPGSAILEGEYGQSGVSLGVPLVFGSFGWEGILQYNLNEEEKQAFAASAEHVKNLLSQCEL